MINLHDFLEPILKNEDNYCQLAYGDKPLLVPFPKEWTREDRDHVIMSSRLHHNLFISQSRDVDLYEFVYLVPTGENTYKPKDSDLTYYVYRAYNVARSQVYTLAADLVRKYINQMRQGEEVILSASSLGLNKKQAKWFCEYLREGGLQIWESYTYSKDGTLGLIGTANLPFSQWVMPESSN